MSCKRNFLSIGQMAKITGVNIKCLRYYDRIGVLKPAFIAPESGYRYYAVTQVYIAEIIRLCVELGIPLRELTEYVDTQEGIDFAALLDFGQNAAEGKLAQIERGLKFIVSLRAELTRLDACEQLTETYSRAFPARHFLVLPYEKGQQDKEFPLALHRLFRLSTEEGAIPLYDYGLLHVFGPEDAEKYIYLEVLAEGSPGGNRRQIPGGMFACMQAEGCCMKHVAKLFPGIVDTQKQGGQAFAIETELLTRDNRLERPRMELQIWKADVAR